VTADLAERRGTLGTVEQSLRAADVPVRPAELILANVVAAVVVPVAAFLLTGSLGKTVVAFVVAAFGPRVALKVMTSRRRKRFNAQLPDALTALAGSLRAGRSVGQAMAALARELPDPMGRELRKVVAEVRLGRSMHEALQDAAARIQSVDFDWAVLAMQIQAEVGGNLAELLDQVADTMRERARMKGEVKALTAEGRASALMLVIMVPGLGLAMKAMNPSYMEPLFSTTTGRILLGISVVMVGGGYFWMNSMVKIDV
jgi:tight adherence protein B